MRNVLLAGLVVALLSAGWCPSAEAGPLRRIAYRATHPFAPVGSYSGPRGVFGRGGNGGCASGGCGSAGFSGGCANGSCSR
jgi:hypothetical protein